MRRIFTLFCLFAIFLIAKCEEKACDEGVDADAFSSKSIPEVKSTENNNENAVKRAKFSDSDNFNDWMNFLSEEKGKIRFAVTKENNVGNVGSVRIYAETDIKKGEPVYSYPVLAMLSAFEARNDEKVGEIFKELTEKETGEKKGKTKKQLMLTDPEIVKLYSIWLKHNPNPNWKAYIDVLPKKFDTPLQWTDEELEELKGSALYEYTYDLKESVDDDYTHVVKKLIEKYPEVFPENVFTLDEWKWATSLLGGRVWRVGRESVIFPLIETFNFAEEPSVSIEFKDNVITLVATKDISKGEKINVCFTDNQMGNRELLDFYGITLPSNPHDNVRVGISIKEDDSLMKGKTRVLKERGLRTSQFYSLKKDGPSKDLIYALRVYHSNVYDFDSMDKARKGKAISHQNELEVTKSLINLCQSGLREYPTTSKEDGELLKKPNLSSRKKRAILLRKSEKKIFLKAIKQSKNVLASVNANWDMRGMDIPLNIKPVKKEKSPSS